MSPESSQSRSSRSAAHTTNGARVPFHRSTLGQEELDAVERALQDGHLVGNGAVSRAVEARLRRLLDASCVLLTPSCTAALELAFMALEIGPGTEVVLPSFTFASCATAILRSGATPVFVDIDPRTLMLDPEQLERAVTRSTRALLCVHYGGFPADMQRLVSFAQRHRLRVVEDAAQALGSTWQGRALGTIGDIGALSFHATKNITCGEGGAFITRDPELARRALVLREKGTNREAFLQHEVDRYTWVDTGGSFVLADILAAILDAQLDRLDEIQRRRQAIGTRYVQALQPLAKDGTLQLPPVADPATVNWHTCYILLPSAAERDRVLQGLRKAGIEASFHFVPLHSSPFAQQHYGYQPDDLPVTESVASRLIRLPIHAHLTDEAQERVLDVLYHLLDRRR